MLPTPDVEWEEAELPTSRAVIVFYFATISAMFAELHLLSKSLFDFSV
jgi:hypothetical protein